MGNHSNKERIRGNPALFLEKLKQAKCGEKIYSCSFDKWCQGRSAVCGFIDTADYCTQRDDFRAKGYLLRPDVTQGRFIRVERLTNGRISVEEPRTAMKFEMNITPCYTCGKIPQRLRLDYRRLVLNYVQQQTAKDGAGVIGCLDNLAVIQFLNRRQCYVPEFYFIDLEKKQLLGKFSTKDSELLWYECFISPDKSRILLRPDMSTQSWTTSDTIKVHTVNSLQVITMRKFADSGGHALAFDNRHGNRYLFRAKEKDIQLFDLNTMDVVQSAKNLPIPCPIKQLKSSPSGEYIVTRCVFPVYSMEYHTNVIAMFGADNLDYLFMIDVRGPYWPISEVINLQVFPRFSECDTAICAMKHSSSKRKVLIYKLPLLCNSLQQCCRRTIRRAIHPQDVLYLPLPPRLVRYLLYQYS